MGVGVLAEVVTKLEPVTRIRVRWVARAEDVVELADLVRAWCDGRIWAIASTGLKAHEAKKHRKMI
jgi:hypothetical protein